MPGGIVVFGLGMVPPRPTVLPKTPEVRILDQRTRNERNWLSRRHRGFALRSRNSLTLIPVSNLKIPFTWEKGNPSAWRNQKLNNLSSSLGGGFSSDEDLRRQGLTRLSPLVAQCQPNDRTRSNFWYTCPSLTLVAHRHSYQDGQPA